MEKAISVKEKIRCLLQNRFNCTQLLIEDESHKHRGHQGAPEGGESHFHITIIAAEFGSLDRLGRQRAIYEALNDLMQNPIHALSIDASPPE